MADGMTQLAMNSPVDVLARIMDEFSFLPDQALDGIVAGAPSGYITPSLAAAILDGRRTFGQLSKPA